MKTIFYIYNYIIYRWKAVNEHGIHSPFVFDLLTNVIYNHNEYYCFKKIEHLRTQLLHSKKKINLTHPALLQNSSSTNETNQQKQSKKYQLWQIIKLYTKSPKYDQLLFRITNHFQPSQIIEIGTSFGITTAYIASANSKNNTITLEKNREIAEIAKQNFKTLDLKNIEQKKGNSEDILKEILTNDQNLLFVFFNGNHCKEETLNYFYLCLEKADETSIFIFDGINSFSEIKEAWNEIKNNVKVTVTLDLFNIGIVFFRKGQRKQHFLIKF